MDRLAAAGRYFGIRIRWLSSRFLSSEFLRQFTFEPLLFSGLQKKRMLLQVLDNAFLLDLSLETPKGALNRFAIENPNFRQKCILRKICDRAVSMRPSAPKACVFSQMPARRASFIKEKTAAYST